MGNVFTRIGEKISDYPLFTAEWEEWAREILPAGPFGFLQSGAGDEVTLGQNREAFSEYDILPRVLRDVSNVDTSIKLFGQSQSMPVMLAPVGFQGIFHSQMELGTVKAAAAAGIPFVASTVTSASLEEIATVEPDAVKWFQLYWSKNRDLTASMAKRAEKAGYKAIVVTVDTGLLGWRKRDYRNGYSPLKLLKGAANYINDPVFQELVPELTEEHIREAILENIHHPNLTWDDLLFLREQTSLPIVVKGILHPADAKQAVALGMDAIVVSNHGGRQLDSAIASLRALPAIAKTVNGAVPVLMDGGVRSGADVFKAIALGADSVLIGRPYVYGLAAGGQAGVSRVIEDLRTELQLTYALSGVARTKDIDAAYLVKR
ncbi:alpha-hydroxy acid oxidase [Terribacillus saccharophilus]|uniref:alpha-hydroxy acid oxidase n=1 Tax=Terribacillus saccharophilus TaxID=361277 RepID=UPI002989F6A5|nr:alpha-hydroxy acid oxidase [Terribacillus saccharophilus]MCM3227281.1 alpha-hydroxy-acid oxidizing protein [Terribacillus saccharophilus]MEC0283939.1 alpha-hydroxy acid oxidase [Terribacillus saccharophilus]MEC0289832.1 alpha-hydroxy acid oxidase [Terribacillus saccharophilus]